MYLLLFSMFKSYYQEIQEMSGLSNLLNKGRYNCNGDQLFTSNPILSPDHHTAMETLYNHLCTRYRNITTPTNHLTSQQPTNQTSKHLLVRKASIPLPHPTLQPTVLPETFQFYGLRFSSQECVACWLVGCWLVRWLVGVVMFLYLVHKWLYSVSMAVWW